jgi:hypothetical protein
MQGGAQNPQPVSMRERRLLGVSEASLCKSCC